MIEQTVHGELVAKKDGIYTIYVFQLDNGEYIMCTKLPNWGAYSLQIGDKGFVTTQSVVAGEQYFDRETQTPQFHQFTGVYFKEFIKDNKSSQEIIL